jgi:hypothetical protein
VSLTVFLKNVRILVNYDSKNREKQSTANSRHGHGIPVPLAVGATGNTILTPVHDPNGAQISVRATRAKREEIKYCG